MLGWFISLILVAICSVGAWIPGAVDSTLTRALQDRVGPTATAQVRVEGDPLLQLPFGHIPSLEARLLGYAVQDVPVRQVTLRLIDVDVDPVQALFARRAVLRRPAGAWVGIEVETAALQGTLDRLAAAGAFSNLQGEVRLFGQRLGGTMNLLSPRLSLEGGRLRLNAEAEMVATGARWPLEASVGVALEDGARLVLTEPRVTLNRMKLPAFLLEPQLARYNPLVDLARLPLPPGRWRLVGLDVTPAGLTLKAAGTLTGLPTP